MKFFRQTKETKRKLSFFLALAMVISLLPVSPVAKAADSTAKVKVECNVTGLTLDKVEQSKSTADNKNVTGSAVISLKAEKEIENVDELTVEIASGSSISNENASVTITGSGVTGKTVCENPKITTDKKGVTITVNNIIADTTVTISGKVKFVTEEEKPVEKVKVTVNSTICDGVELSATVGGTKIATGTAVDVDKNSTVTITVKPTNTKATWSEEPTITVGNSKLTWTANGTTLTATTPKIATNTIITVSGGKLLVVSDKVTTTAAPATIEDTATKEEIGDTVSFVVPEKEGLVSDILKNVPTEIKAAIENALAGEAKITTSLGVEKVKESDAKAAKDEVSNSKTEDIIDIPKSFGTTNDEKQKTIKSLVEDGVVLDINLTSIIEYKNGDTTTSASIGMKNLNNKVKVTMNIPKTLKDKYSGKKGVYFVIRIHDGKITIIPCNETDGKLTFESNQFSTYIVTFKEGDTTPTPTPGNNNGYIPGPGQSTAPSANPSTAPSTNPSANPSTAPSTNPSVAPSANPSGAPTDPTNAPTEPTKAPTEPTKAPVNPTKKPSTSVKVGKKATISGSQYKVTAVKGTRTVQFTKGKKNAKKIVIPSTVKVSGKSYKVTTIAKNALKGNKKLTKLTIGANVKKIGANAFKNCSKLKSIVIKTTKLTKSKVGTNAFKGINAKATVKVPKAKVKAYKKIVKAKGAGKNVKVKK